MGQNTDAASSFNGEGPAFPDMGRDEPAKHQINSCKAINICFVKNCF